MDQWIKLFVLSMRRAPLDISEQFSDISKRLVINAVTAPISFFKKITTNSTRTIIKFHKSIESCERGDIESSIYFMSCAFKLEPDSFEIMNNMGVLFEWAGKRSDSICFFREALKKFSQAKLMRYNLGTLLFMRKRYSEAREELEKCLRDDCIDFRFKLSAELQKKALLNLAMTLYKCGEVKKGKCILYEIVEQDPEFDAAYHNLGYISYFEKKFDESIFYFDKAILYDSKYPFSYNDRGCAYFCNGNIDEAYKDFEKAFLLDPYGDYSPFNFGFTALLLQMKKRNSDYLFLDQKVVERAIPMRNMGVFS